MARRATSNYAQVKLTVTVEPGMREGRPPRLDWRLWAKAPAEEWSIKHSVGHGSTPVATAYPPSRDDMLALMIELLMSMEWTALGVQLHG